MSMKLSDFLFKFDKIHKKIQSVFSVVTTVCCPGCNTLILIVNAIIFLRHSEIK